MLMLWKNDKTTVDLLFKNDLADDFSFYGTCYMKELNAGLNTNETGLLKDTIEGPRAPKFHILHS